MKQRGNPWREQKKNYVHCAGLCHSHMSFVDILIKCLTKICLIPAVHRLSLSQEQSTVRERFISYLMLEKGGVKFIPLWQMIDKRPCSGMSRVGVQVGAWYLDSIARSLLHKLWLQMYVTSARRQCLYPGLSSGKKWRHIIHLYSCQWLVLTAGFFFIFHFSTTTIVCRALLWAAVHVIVSTSCYFHRPDTDNRE